MSKKIILTHPEHPLYHLLLENFEGVLLYSSNLKGSISVPKKSIVFDFTLLRTEEKRSLLRELGPAELIYTDTTCSWGDLLWEEFPELSGAFACGIYSPLKTYEASLRSLSLLPPLEEIFKALDLKVKPTSTPGLGHIHPRVITQIINEAYLALDEGLATKEDIDQAMHFGLNYPLGPIEWAERSGLIAPYLLLEELLSVTQKSRYRPALGLKKAALLKMKKGHL